MNNRKLLIFASFLLLAGCTTDPDMDNNVGGGTSAQTPSAKIVNTSADAAAETLLVYFNDRAVESIESTAAATRTAATRSGVASVDDVLSRLEIVSLERLFTYDARSEEQTRAAGLHKWYILTFGQGADLEKAARELAGVAEVSRIQFDTKLQKASVGNPMPFRIDETGTTRADFSGSGFNDPGLPNQWHYSNNGDKMFAATTAAGADINVPEAWKLTGGSPSIIVAIVDEGVKYTHPDLADNMWVNKAELNGAADTDNDGNGYKNDVHGYNFATNSSDLTWSVSHYDNKGKYDGDSGHGTHVAGTVAAVNNNGKGVCGVAGGTGSNDGVKLMSCQIFSGGNGGTISTSVRAIKYAADNGASIIQCSWGYPTQSPFTSDSFYERNYAAEKEAIDYFVSKKNNDVLDGGLAIFAAGNDATNFASYPGGYRSYVSVTSFGPDYLPAYYTNYGPGCNVAAPSRLRSARSNTPPTTAPRSSSVRGATPLSRRSRRTAFMKGITLRKKRRSTTSFRKRTTTYSTEALRSSPQATTPPTSQVIRAATAATFRSPRSARTTCRPTTRITVPAATSRLRAATPASRPQEPAPRRCFRHCLPSCPQNSAPTEPTTATCRAPRWPAPTYRASLRWDSPTRWPKAGITRWTSSNRCS